MLHSTGGQRRLCQLTWSGRVREGRKIASSIAAGILPLVLGAGDVLGVGEALVAALQQRDLHDEAVARRA